MLKVTGQAAQGYGQILGCLWILYLIFLLFCNHIFFNFAQFTIVTCLFDRSKQKLHGLI